MRKNKWLWLVIGIVLVLLGGIWFTTTRVTNTPQANPKNVGDYHTPTLFVHGFGGGYGSEKDMIDDLSKHAGFRQVLRFDVDNNDHAQVSGNWPVNVRYPLIAIVFKSGRPDSTALVKILENLKKEYGIKNFNAVGHSAGSTAWANWAVTDAANTKEPTLRKLITIAGPFNGFPGMDKAAAQATLDKDGKPSYISSRYEPLLENRQHFPTTAAVLNLYGDMGDGSDSRVPVVSARALRYIVEPRAKSYTERVIKNNLSQHSKLHEHNPLVNRYLYEFLTVGKITN
ncbi:MAG: alpha/beta fold hydrolase [Schleiferilactobacillus perolens]|uniref:alpha/beta fold hydrolase n=1 Tax=Schleiferilactobacillus perolens TaxID=100468 RepID=UPI0039EB3C5D